MTLSSGDRLLPLSLTDTIAVDKFTSPSSSGDRFVLAKTTDGVVVPVKISRLDTSGDRGFPAALYDGVLSIIKIGEELLNILYGWRSYVGDGSSTDYTYAVGVSIPGGAILEGEYVVDVKDSGSFTTTFLTNKNRVFYIDGTRYLVLVSYDGKDISTLGNSPNRSVLIPSPAIAEDGTIYIDSGTIISGATNAIDISAKAQYDGLLIDPVLGAGGWLSSPRGDPILNIQAWGAIGNGDNAHIGDNYEFIPTDTELFSMPEIKRVISLEKAGVYLGVDGSLWYAGMNRYDGSSNCVGFQSVAGEGWTTDGFGGNKIFSLGNFTNNSQPHRMWIYPTKGEAVPELIDITTLTFGLSFIVGLAEDGILYDLNGVYPREVLGAINVSSIETDGLKTTNGESRQAAVLTDDDMPIYEITPFINKVEKTNGRHFLVTEAPTSPDIVYVLWAYHYDVDSEAWEIVYAGTTYTEISDWEQHGTTYYKTTKPTFSGTGLDDIYIYPVRSMKDHYDGDIKIRISTAGAIRDQIQYSTNGGASWSSEYYIYENTFITIVSDTDSGIRFLFSSINGHTEGDEWSIAPEPSPPSPEPAAPTVYYYWQSVYTMGWAYQGVEYDFEWLTPMLLGKSTVGSAHGWKHASKGVAALCSTSASTPSVPSSAPGFVWGWQCKYHCDNEAWYAIRSGAAKTIGGSHAYVVFSGLHGQGNPADTNGGTHFENLTPYSDWTLVPRADYRYYKHTFQGAASCGYAYGNDINDNYPFIPPEPSFPSFTPTCYYTWTASYNCMTDEWSLSLQTGATISGSTSDWGDCSSGYCSRVTNSKTEPSPPSESISCYFYWEAWYDCFSSQWYVYLVFTDSTGTISDWSCDGSCIYCTKVTTSSFTPSPPTCTPDCP